MNHIYKSDIIVNAKFKNKHGDIFVIDKISNSSDFDVLWVETSVSPFFTKGNYRNEINDLINFLNEENCIKI
jgi:hypothetical protein